VGGGYLDIRPPTPKIGGTPPPHPPPPRIDAHTKIAVEAKTALLSRQFMRGLPSSIRRKLLAHNPTPTLSEMLSLSNVIERLKATKSLHIQAQAHQHTSRQRTCMDQLVGLMTELVTRQKALEDKVATS
jgi:hypothetical protein